MKKNAVIVVCLFCLAHSTNAQDTVFFYDTLNPACPTGHYQRLVRGSQGQGQILASRYITPTPMLIGGITLQYDFGPLSATKIMPALIYEEKGIRKVAYTDTLSYLNYQDQDSCLFNVRIYPSCTNSATFDTNLKGYKMYFKNPIRVEDTFYIGTLFSTTCCWYDVRWRIFNLCGPHTVDNVGTYWFLIPSLTINGGSGWEMLLCSPIIAEPDAIICQAVEDLVWDGMDSSGYPVFSWSALEDDSVAYEICYGPYDQEVDSLGRTTTLSSPFVLRDGTLSPNVYYQARCRTRCHHVCAWHDTVMTTRWSDPVYFYTGSSMPDTTHTTDTTQGIVLPDGGLAGSVRLMPNPASDQVLVLSDHRMLGIEVYQADGRRYATLEAEGYTSSLSVQNWLKGVYVLRVHTAAGTVMRKLTVE